MTNEYAIKKQSSQRANIIHLRTDTLVFRSPNKFKDMSKKVTNSGGTDWNYGGITIAYKPVIIHHPNGKKLVFAEVGVSICSGHDRYVRKTGRLLAEKYLEEGFLPEDSRYQFHFIGEASVVSKEDVLDFKFYFEYCNKVVVATEDGEYYVPHVSTQMTYDVQEMVLKQLG